jgi:hypothetical protein
MKKEKGSPVLLTVNAANRITAQKFGAVAKLQQLLITLSLCE